MTTRIVPNEPTQKMLAAGDLATNARMVTTHKVDG